MHWTPPFTDRWTVGDDLTWCQLFLHDAGALFAREELLRWYQDGYRQLLGMAQSTRQWRILDVPPRYTITYTFAWEQYHTLQGTSRAIGYRGRGGRVYTYLWEAEQAEGLPVTDGSSVCCTQLWEYAYLPEDSPAPNQTYTFAVPRAQERLARVYWDHKALTPRAMRELDATEALWWRESGEPWIWTRGTQGVRHFDLYQIQTGYQQGYALSYNEATATGGMPGVTLGIPREMSGDRTYDWVSDDAAAPYGIIRDISSPDRQYLAQPTWQPPYGRALVWGSSAHVVMLWEVVLPDHQLLREEDTPEMIPAPLQKYVRCYVLWQAFGHQGEGEKPELAAWFEQRWQRGVTMMRRLGIVTRRDRGYQRVPLNRQSRAVPRPRLPSDFPRWVGV